MRKIATYQLEPFQPLWRVHHVDFSANQFNDSTQGNGRFNPLMAKQSYRSSITVYPTLYAANQYHDALSETLMRKDRLIKILTEQTLASHQLSVISPKSLITVADLDGDWVPSIIKQALYQPQSNGVYSLLREFAIRLVNVAPHIQGLKWRSVQRNVYGQSIYVLINHPKVTPPTQLLTTSYSTPLNSRMLRA